MQNKHTQKKHQSQTSFMFDGSCFHSITLGVS